MSTYKLSIAQVLMIVGLAIGLTNHVTSIPLLLQTGERDAWICVIFGYILILLWTLLLYLIMKKTGQQNILKWIKETYGAFSAKLLALLFAVYIFLNVAIATKETMLWIKIYYLPSTPQRVIALSLILVSLFAAFRGMEAIAVTSGILFPLVAIFGFFAAFANIPHKRYSMLFPMFTNDVSSLAICTLHIAGALIELVMLLLLQQDLSVKIKCIHLVVLLSAIIFFTVGPLIGCIVVFGLEAIQMRYPVFDLWRLVTVGRYITRVDFLAIFQWLSGSVIRISFSILLLSRFIQFKDNQKRKGFMILLACFMFILPMLPIRNQLLMMFMQNYFIVVFFSVLFITIIIALLTMRKSKKGSTNYEKIPHSG